LTRALALLGHYGEKGKRAEALAFENNYIRIPGLKSGASEFWAR